MTRRELRQPAPWLRPSWQWVLAGLVVASFALLFTWILIDSWPR